MCVSVLDFDPNEALLSKEEEDISEEFGNLKNLPGLFCALRDAVSKR